MKHFQKIKTLDSETVFENKLKEKGVDVVSIQPGHHVVITEKVDGSNAQFTSHFGELEAFSHHKKLDEHNNSLNGFFQFVMDHQNFAKLSSNLSVFGEWLTPHKIKYKADRYKKFYVFDVFNFDSGCFMGYLEARNIYNKLFSEYEDVEMAPLLLESDNINMDQLDEIKSNYSKKSKLSISGNMEGIVVSDLSTLLGIDQETNGPLRIKLVNEAFKETRKQANTTDDNLFNWLAENVTLPRIQKQIFSLQEDNEIPTELGFDWLSTTISKRIALETVLDAIKETQNLPESIKLIQRFSRKQTNKFIALSAKGMI